MPFRNMPALEPLRIGSLLDAAPGQVSSMDILSSAVADAVILAFSAGESVSAEEYFTDTLFLCIENSFDIVLYNPSKRITVAQGEALLVPARTSHAIEGTASGGFKILQINA